MRPSRRSRLNNSVGVRCRWTRAGVALFDAGYGNNSAFRSEVTALGLTYVAGIVPTTTVWAPGTAPLPPKRWSGRGRRPTRLRRDAKHRPVTVKELALSLSRRAWRTINGAKARPSRWFRALRACVLASLITTNSDVTDRILQAVANPRTTILGHML